jgi:arylsulfatase A-like enzyme
MQTKHYGTLAGDDELVSDKPEPPNNSAELDEELRRAGVQTGPSRVVATIGLVVSAVFVGLVLLVAVTNGGRDMSTLTSFGASVTSIMSALQAPSAQTYDLQDPTQDVTIITTTTTVSTEQYPNFVVIVADDLGWNALSYNDEDISFATPTLAGLASKGIIMGNYYAQEVCSPSRASLLTGRYPLSVGMQYGMVAATAEWGLDLDEVTIAEVLSDNGYKTHMLGKWHLGYFSPLFLPTARGFDDYIGYVNGENYYWSKRSTDYPEFVDFMEADRDCYKPYNGSDMHDYSTTFYTNHAIQIIDDHPTEEPLFLYLAYQAVHDPFVDTGKFRNGMPDSLMDADVLSQIHTNIVGTQRKEYIKSLYQLDKHVGYVYDKLVEKDMMDNTYIIFMSDNGGCFYGGGKNGPLRGSKGSLFEGGIKVDSFIYSPKLKSGGTTYDGLMHVSDWFPTMLALAGITYTPDSEHSLDGVNQVDGWLNVRTPRDTLLYNYYTALTDYSFNIWYNGTFAVRDERFKLMHTYDDSLYGAWYNPTDIVDTDEELTEDNRCAQQFLSGDFTYWLFDLQEDPYETTNLYDSTDEIYTSAKDKLYTLLPGFEARAKTKISIHWSSKSKKYWQQEGNYVLPWANEDNLPNKDVKDWPSYCPDTR